MISPIGTNQRPNSSRKGFTPLEICFRRRIKKSLTGFTLIELVLVILLVSVIAALSTPLFRRTFSDLELKGASFTMAKLINYARQTAIIEKANYKLNLDFAEGKFWITKRDSAAGEAEYKGIGSRYGKVFSLPGGVRFADADGNFNEKSEIVFYPDGRSAGGDIKIVNKAGDGRILRVRGFGRRVEIEGVEN